MTISHIKNLNPQLSIFISDCRKNLMKLGFKSLHCYKNLYHDRMMHTIYEYISLLPNLVEGMPIDLLGIYGNGVLQEAYAIVGQYITPISCEEYMKVMQNNKNMLEMENYGKFMAEFSCVISKVTALISLFEKKMLSNDTIVQLQLLKYVAECYYNDFKPDELANNSYAYTKFYEKVEQQRQDKVLLLKRQMTSFTR